MNADARQNTLERDPLPEEFAEAAAWVARLHGPNRTRQVEQGLRRWLAEKPGHAAAFESMTAAWEVTGRLPKEPFPRLSRWQRAGYREGFIRSAAVAASMAALVVGAIFYIQSAGGIGTQVGEQRTLTLKDGSRVFLNTNTRIVVSYGEKTRKVELKSGEALFEVAKAAHRPFIVQAGERAVTALGTSFVVRYDRDRTVITLVEGKVAVAPFRSAATAPLPATLTPGQRLTFVSRKPPRFDEPPLEKVTAWRRGLVDFENTPLSQAVEEMNRYSETKIAIESPQALAIPITGVFRAGDTASFATALAKAYPLKFMENRDEIRIMDLRAAPPRISQIP